MFAITQELIQSLQLAISDKETDPIEYMKTNGMISQSSKGDRGKQIAILHCSDLHFTDKDDGKQKRILSCIRSITEREDFLDGFLFTGDCIDASAFGKINNASRKAEAFKKMFDFILNANDGDISKVISVPGNHDIETVDPANKGFFSKILCSLLNASQTIMNEGMSKNHDARTDYSTNARRLNLYHNNFEKHLLTNLFNGTPMSVFPVALLLERIEVGVVVVLGFDSTICDSGEPGNMGLGFVSSEQIDMAKLFIDLLKQVYAHIPIVTIAAFHHHLIPLAPLVDKAPSDVLNNSVRFSLCNSRKLIEDLHRYCGVSIFLHGHQHTLMSYDVGFRRLDRYEAWGGSCYSLGNVSKQGLLYLGILRINFDTGRYFYVPHISEQDPQDSNNECQRNSVNHWNYIRPANEITCEEQNLYHHVISDEHVELTDEFRIESQKVWEKYHIALISPIYMHPTNHHEFQVHGRDSFFSDSFFSRDKSITSPREYSLLVLLRRSRKNGLEILLNYHRDIESPLFAGWNCFLLPASRKSFSASRFLDYLCWTLQRKHYYEHHTKLQQSYQRSISDIQRIKGKMTSSTFSPLCSNGSFPLTKEFYRISPTSRDFAIMRYSLVGMSPELWGEEMLSVIKQALQYVDDLDEFERFFRGSQGKEVRRGLCWVPLRYWHHRKMDFFRNGDVLKWIEDLILPTDSRHMNLHDCAEYNCDASKCPIYYPTKHDVAKHKCSGIEHAMDVMEDYLKLIFS